MTGSLVKIGSWKPVIRLFEAGVKMPEIARKYGCSRSLISIHLREYYKKHRAYRNIYLIKTCTICGVEEESLLATYPIYRKGYDLKAGDETIKEKFICPLCFYNRLFLCTCCGAIVQEEEIPAYHRGRGIITQRGICRECLNNKTYKWARENPERWKEIQDNRRKELAKKGLCVICGHPADGHRRCKKCRNKSNKSCKLYRNRKNEQVQLSTW